VENPLNTSPCSMDGNRGKSSALITRLRIGGIKRVEPVTNNKHDKLTSGSRPIDLTLGDRLQLSLQGTTHQYVCILPK
jgi:hypothetical protein